MAKNLNSPCWHLENFTFYRLGPQVLRSITTPFLYVVQNKGYSQKLQTILYSIVLCIGVFEHGNINKFTIYSSGVFLYYALQWWTRARLAAVCGRLPAARRLCHRAIKRAFSVETRRHSDSNYRPPCKDIWYYTLLSGAPSRRVTADSVHGLLDTALYLGGRAQWLSPSLSVSVVAS